MASFARFRNAATAAVCLSLLSVHGAHAGPLGDFNVLTFGSFNEAYTDVQGRLYAGGEVTLNGYSVGDNVPPSQVGGDSLVVGGNLSFTNGMVRNGNVAVGGSSTTSGFGLDSGYTVTDNLGASGLPVDFASEQTRLTGLSAALGTLSSTGTAGFNSSTLVLTGDGSANEQVFTINGSDFQSASGLQVDNVAAGTDLIINVLGASITTMNASFGNYIMNNADHVLFNFVDADALNLNSFYGSILAPTADVQGNWAALNGQFVANSVVGNTQFNEVLYNGGVPPLSGSSGDTPVPEPDVTGLMLLSVVGLGWLRRRQRRSRKASGAA